MELGDVGSPGQNSNLKREGATRNEQHQVITRASNFSSGCIQETMMYIVAASIVLSSCIRTAIPFYLRAACKLSSTCHIVRYN
jgi:hypothetical protein